MHNSPEEQSVSYIHMYHNPLDQKANALFGLPGSDMDKNIWYTF